MKKGIFISIALLMILCLALAGCGQRGSNTNDSSNHTASQNEENTTVNDTDVETEEPTETETETETNPSNSDSGMYSYELHGGITISCKTNVWDYIDGNTFNFRDMAHDLGFERDGNDYSSCSRFYHDPSDELVVIGVTGTKGKTTTTYMIREMLELAGIKTGLIGTEPKGSPKRSTFFNRCYLYHRVCYGAMAYELSERYFRRHLWRLLQSR